MRRADARLVLTVSSFGSPPIMRRRAAAASGYRARQSATVAPGTRRALCSMAAENRSALAPRCSFFDLLTISSAPACVPSREAAQRRFPVDGSTKRA